MTERIPSPEPLPATLLRAQANPTASLPHHDPQSSLQPVARCWALVPCAGVGARAVAANARQPELPKQYQEIAGQPMVMHTLAALLGVQRVHQVLLVISSTDGFWQGRAGEPHAVDARLRIAPCGGATRAESVRNGLQELLRQGADATDWVLVHDAARCLLTPAQVNTLIDACLPDAVGGLLALKLPDTLKQAQTGGRDASGQEQARVAQTVDRSDKWLAQTPQMFRIGALLEALQAAEAHGAEAVTDEASAMELVGYAPRLVEGGAQNFKVTYPDDFALAEAVLQARHSRTEPKPCE